MAGSGAGYMPDLAAVRTALPRDALPSKHYKLQIATPSSYRETYYLIKLIVIIGDKVFLKI